MKNLKNKRKSKDWESFKLTEKEKIKIKQLELEQLITISQKHRKDLLIYLRLLKVKNSIWEEPLNISKLLNMSLQDLRTNTKDQKLKTSPYKDS